MAACKAVLLLFLVVCLHQSATQKAEKLINLDPCETKETCHDCIQTPSCAWCFKPEFADRKRCFQPSSTRSEDQCPEEFVYNADNVMSLMVNKQLSRAHSMSGASAGAAGGSMSGSYSGSSSGSMSGSSSGYGAGGSSASGEIIQVSPQRLSLKLRARQSYSIYMQYTQAEDYPVDLYYLMDLSKSMEDDKEKLSSLGKLLAESMQNITSNFRLGFGSFVDKVVMPYVSTIPENLREPCSGCAAPYGYRHSMRLSKNTDIFSQMVKEAAVSGNLDAPEGGFDAIMQAVVCRDQIGWREKARRLLVFSTDAGFHYAGDGKLGGIVKPNDGMCHLNTSGSYTHSSVQDYPSISQINLKVKQNAINVIFAVTEQQLKLYQKLQSHIEGAFSGQLSNDSSNVVDLVKEQYEQISSSVEMKDNATGAVSISYFSECLNPTGRPMKTNKCEKIKVGDVITFRLDFELLKCPKDPKDWFQTIQIYPVGLNESLTVDLEMLCSCPCEHEGDSGYKKRARECNMVGTLKCGICECDKDHIGRFCECNATDTDLTSQTSGCRPKDSNIECSNRGSCICNRCECDNSKLSEGQMIYGTYCQCDNFSCPRKGDLMCSGHGQCKCGNCVCEKPWTGNDCSCFDSPEGCYAKDSNVLCSGAGECECGKCKCNVTSTGRYSGQFCERCPTCPDRCDELRHCVQCQQYETGIYSKEECMEKCTHVNPIPKETVTANEENNEYSCTYYDEDDCRFAFVYTEDKNKNPIVWAQENRECPPKVFLLGIVLGVIAAIVLMGLAILLLWKLLTTIHDRREFAKFEKERMMAKWDTGENPIYKQATSTFKNPTYAGKG